MYIKKIDLTREFVAEWLSYDAETGIFRWLKNRSRKYKAGQVAGSLKTVGISTGEVKKYRYLTLDGVSSPAARFAWLLHYGEWPTANVHCKDGDTDNLRIANLELSKFPAVVEDQGLRRVYRMSKDAQRHYGLKRYYGLTGEEYGQMVADQKGVCAICEKPETAMANGKMKPLSVDHNHTTGKLRGLLCDRCNHMLGHARENRDVLLSAIKYLDHHNGETAPKPELAVVDGNKESE